MEIITSVAEMTAWSNQRLKAAETIALVPTMGCLHTGHLSLLRTAQGAADVVVLSIFVNPLQFGPNEDFSRYPRPFTADCEAIAANQGDVVFAPQPSSFYPDDFATTVTVRGLTAGLCGASRPGHFDGVSTVVAKLFHVVKPNIAVFGQKDFQQLAVIKAMTADLNWDIEIIGHPIVRESDGLAMSSRNRYLSPTERQSALCLWQGLHNTRHAVKHGEHNCHSLLAQLRAQISTDPTVEIDYLSIVDDTTLQPQTQIDTHSILAMAIKIGTTRLIDNGYLTLEESL
ncbi:MAG: pantoate--beta-alanine ligase [Desulfobulbaceae bacterium]|nr:pantoate--beta-alanine ligase [Desulfobulbaceae bacterium]